MKDIITVTDEMLRCIEESDSYKNYISAKEKVCADSELLDKMKEFKNLHIIVQGKKLNGESIDFGEEINVSRMYFSLMQNKTAAAYFKSEEEILSLLRIVYEKLGCRCSELLKEF